jgi:amidase
VSAGALWRLGAGPLAAAIRAREVSAREAAASVLARADALNPRINALTELLHKQALAAADAADAALKRGDAVGPLHGVPVTMKCNVDQAGLATTNGLIAAKDLVAHEDSPPVANLKRAGAIVIGRSNTPAMSLRWFTDNTLHGRTLNPYDDRVTPGGSSGGAAVALALGVGAIAHGNDYGGSIRHPAACCGVVGLRPSVGRVPAYNATAREERGISGQLMAVQGPLARNVGDVRVGLRAMAQRDARDPLWLPAPLRHDGDERPQRVALFKRHPAYDTDPSVRSALEQAARALAAAGYAVEEAEPPHFEEAAELWRSLVYGDLARLRPLIDGSGDAALMRNFALSTAGRPTLDRDAYLAALARRTALARAWSIFFEDTPLLLLPVSWRRPFAIDEDQHDAQRMNAVIAAQSPLLATAMLGLPGLALPTGLAGGLPTSVQLVGARWREELLLRAGEVIERAAAFSAIDHLTA